MKINTIHDFIGSLRDGAYTGLGGYPKYWITEDGGILSHRACLENVLAIGRAIRYSSEPQWRVIGCDVNWEDPDLMCDDSGERIQSAYAEDEVVRPKPDVGKRTA